jgi:hypothetical protein
MKESPYYVWRRNDGLVSSSRTKPYNYTGANGCETSFVLLGTFERWEDALKLIEQEQVVRT